MCELSVMRAGSLRMNLELHTSSKRYQNETRRGSGGRTRSEFRSLASRFELSLLSLLLAFDAMPRPGNSFETLRIDFLAAGDTLAKAAFTKARERAVDESEQLPIIVALAE